MRQRFFGLLWAAALAPGLAPAQSDIFPHWSHVPPLFYKGGEHRQAVVDLDGDGQDEVLTRGKAAPSNWPDERGALALFEGADTVPGRLRAAGGRIGFRGRNVVVARDFPGFPGDSVLAYGCDGDVASTCLLRGKSLTIAARFPATPEPILVANLAGDGRPEALVLREGGFDIYDVRTGERLRSSPVLSSIRQIAVGQLDDDAPLEIAVLAGEPGGPAPLRIFDGLALQEKWAYADGGWSLSIGKAAAGRDRLVLTASSSAAVLVDGAPLRVTRVVPAPDPWGYRYQLLDVDGDGRSELLRIGLIAIDVIDADTLQTRFSTASLSNAGEMMPARLGGGLGRRLLWFDANFGASRNDMHMVELVPGAAVQAQPSEGPSFAALAVGNIDHGAGDEVVFVSTVHTAGPPYEDDTLRVLDRATGQEQWSLALGNQQARPLALLRTSAQSPPKIFLPQADTVAVVDGTTRRVAYTLASRNPRLSFEQQVGVMRAADVDGDGREALLLASGTRLLVIDPVTNALKWERTLPSFIRDIQVVAKAPGTAADVLVLQSLHATLLSGAAHQPLWTTPLEGSPYDWSRYVCGTWVEFGAQGPEVVVGVGKNLWFLDATDGTLLRRHEVPRLYLAPDIRFVAAPGRRVDRLVTNSHDGLQVVDGRDGQPVWSVPVYPLGAQAGSGNIAHIEADPASGRHEVVIGSHAGVSALSIVDRDGVFANGFDP